MFDLSTTITMDRVTVAYPNGKVALRDASMTIPRGSICGLIGVNGGGKSTMFKTLMGFIPLQRGAVSLLGLSVKQAQRQNMVAYVPQSGEIDWNFPVDVTDVVMMGRYGYMGIRRTPRPADHRAVAHALDRVAMGEFRHRQIGELSGGQRQRAFLARAVAQQGSVMLLDEPLSGVDSTTRSTILSLLTELRDNGQTIIISTHDLASVESFCDEVVLVNGTVIAAGPTAVTFTVENLARTFGGEFPMLFQLTTGSRLTPMTGGPQ